MDDAEREARIAEARRLAALASPLEVLLETLRNDIRTGDAIINVLDRVADDELPQLAEAVVQHLPSQSAKHLGGLLLLQAPQLMAGHADEVDEPMPFMWHALGDDEESPSVALSAHHLVFGQRDVDYEPRFFPDEPVERWRAVPNPTWQPTTPAVGHARVGGAAEGECAACGWPLQRVLALADFPGAEQGVVPRELVTCVNAPCMWSVQYFAHDGDRPRALPRVNDLPDYGMPQPDPVPELSAALHLTPPRWGLQDWGGRQNLNRVGGHASWIQEAWDPDCPQCRLAMPFVAQLDGLTEFVGAKGWSAWTEGLLYAYWCADCKVSAITTQQT